MVEKFLRAIKSPARILVRRKKGISGVLHYVHLHSDQMAEDLIHLGITPKKSLSLAFPPVPPDFLRHFLRGAWDGDGTVGKPDASPRARLFSGSKPSRSVRNMPLSDWESRGSCSRNGQPITGKSVLGAYQTAALAHVLYSGVNSELCLDRKRTRFMATTEWLANRLGERREKARQNLSWLEPILAAYPLP